MVSYELRLDKQSGGGYFAHSSANAATQGRGGSWGRGGPANSWRGCGRSRGNGCGPGLLAPLPHAAATTTMLVILIYQLMRLVASIGPNAMFA
jgi:hypothetical protein